MSKLVVSFSGGRTSAKMVKDIRDNLEKFYEIIYIFANTGKERYETLDFVNECANKWSIEIIWVEANINPIINRGTRATVVNYNSASRNGEPFEAMIKKYGIPNVAFPHCTRELKAVTIRSYIKSIGWKYYDTAIGIRADEIDRINPNAKKLGYFYPLVESGVTKRDIYKFWDKQQFDLQLYQHEGNCDLCFKKSFRKLMMILQNNPELAKWWQYMEQKYENYLPPTHNQECKLPIRFFRNNKSVDDLFRMVQRARLQLRLFEDLDISNGCTESCEVF